MTNEPKQGGCGLWKIWWFQGRFKDACRGHDTSYELYSGDSWWTGERSLWGVDRQFLIAMLERSDHTGHVLQAFLMWAIAHAYGLIFWKGARGENL